MSETQTITLADAAYFAGLFDGEGSVYYKKTKQKIFEQGL